MKKGCDMKMPSKGKKAKGGLMPPGMPMMPGMKSAMAYPAPPKKGAKKSKKK